MFLSLHTVPYRDDREDLPALIEKARETEAKLIYFANPDNPMGSWISGQRITELLDDLPATTLLVLRAFCCSPTPFWCSPPWYNLTFRVWFGPNT